MKIINESLLITISMLSLILSQTTHEVSSGNYYYNPSTLTIDAGDTVKWINNGGFHDVVVTSGPVSYQLPACSGPCTIGEIVFDVPGTYDYICSIGSHASNGMVGTIVVQQVVNPTASVQIIHNSASPTVDVYVDGELAVEDFEYRTATPVLDLPTDFTVGIAPADGEVIAEFPFSLMDSGTYVVVATGLLGDETTPFSLAAAGTTNGATDGNVGLNVYHGSTDAPAVDVIADGAVLVPNLEYGSFSGYVEVPANDYTIGIAPTGGDAIAEFIAPLSGLGGNSAVVFASGFLSGQDPAFGLFAALEDGSVLGLNPPVNPTASVQIIHNSASPTVDVYVDGELAVEDFEYRTATPVLDLPTDFTVGIAPADGEVIAEFPFSLMDSGTYVVVATGLLGDETTPFSLAAAGTTNGATDGNVGLNVYHGSTDAPAVDVIADGAVLVPNLEYGSFSGYVEVPANDYTIGIAPTGGDAIAEFIAPLSGLGGNSAVVFASGFLSGQDPAFGLFAALEDGSVLALESGNLSTNIIIDNSFTLYPNYPNPFNPSTTISYELNELSDISINIYDLNGKIVESLFNGYKNEGTHSIVWEANNLSSGTYLLVINSNNIFSTQKLMLIK